METWVDKYSSSDNNCYSKSSSNIYIFLYMLRIQKDWMDFLNVLIGS